MKNDKDIRLDTTEDTIPAAQSKRPSYMKTHNATLTSALRQNIARRKQAKLRDNQRKEDESSDN